MTSTTVAAKRVAKRLAGSQHSLLLRSQPSSKNGLAITTGSLVNASASTQSSVATASSSSTVSHSSLKQSTSSFRRSGAAATTGSTTSNNANNASTVATGPTNAPSRSTSPLPSSASTSASRKNNIHAASKPVLDRLQTTGTTSTSTNPSSPTQPTNNSFSQHRKWSATSASTYHTFAHPVTPASSATSSSSSASFGSTSSSSSSSAAPCSASTSLKSSYHTRAIALPVSAIGNNNDGVPWFDKQSASSIFELFEKVKAIPQTRRSFRFTHAASAMPKASNQTVINDGRFLSVGAGEDAFFSRHDSMGVADGVGGWSHVKGANPALYSRKLMHYASLELEKYDDIANNDFDMEEYYNVDPKVILQKSYDAVQSDAPKEGLVGSTTALIVVLRDDELRITNLGDCGVMIIRDNESIFRTEEQQHSFNFPFQLGTGSHDTPDSAQSFQIKVQEGDIVIIGSDGMFDNVFDEEVVDIVRSVTDRVGVAKDGKLRIRDVDPQRITDALISRAREVAEDTRFAASPFQSRAIQEGLYYQGGKLDDISVLAGVIRLSEDSPDRR
ncbi:hypothetical protein SmJEL517_g01031 [Synchytrium microbalum]|uniref:Protein phosphatase n=1 Tax=Synchytrium microbalum TaxID=1806994 RepID=A0A507C6C5_9FUNG|nr:uncharacterized protein SmJEL517_g01031 [Synchytrium microbalum]TPX37140.1 hypothetical protein SmJEL517_g01031 [Synchytrium microbalum]